MGRFYNSPGFSDEESWCFLATDLTNVPDARHGIEEQHMTVERHPLSQADELVRSGRDHGRQDDRGALLGAEPAVLNKWRAHRGQPDDRGRPEMASSRSAFQAEELLSWLAVEKGRSPNTLAAYRRDLVAYEVVAAGAQGIDPASVADGSRRRGHSGPVRRPIFAPLDWRRPRWPGRWSRCARCTGSWCWRGRPRRPDVRLEAAAGPPGPPQGFERRGGGLPSGRGHRRGPGAAPGPGRPRAPLRDGHADLRADRPFAPGPGHRRTARPGPRQGQQGAPGPARPLRPPGPGRLVGAGRTTGHGEPERGEASRLGRPFPQLRGVVA